jgi:hypothetical protein
VVRVQQQLEAEEMAAGLCSEQGMASVRGWASAANDSVLATWKEKAGNGVRKGKELEKLGRWRQEHGGFSVEFSYIFSDAFLLQFGSYIGARDQPMMYYYTAHFWPITHYMVH